MVGKFYCCLQAENVSIVNEIHIFLVPQKLQSTLTFHLQAERTSGLEKKKKEIKKGQVFSWRHLGEGVRKKSFILKLSTGIFHRDSRGETENQRGVNARSEVRGRPGRK